MNRRFDVKGTSEVRLDFRSTKEEALEARALAEYLGMPLSKLIRDLLKEKRRQLIEEGQRPPKKPRDT